MKNTQILPTSLLLKSYLKVTDFQSQFSRVFGLDQSANEDPEEVTGDERNRKCKQRERKSVETATKR